MNSDEFRRLVVQEPGAMSDADLVALLRYQYTGDTVPPCRVCGAALSIASMGGGQATVYACAGVENGTGETGTLRQKVGRSVADEHYSKSQWTRYKDGDAYVLELLQRFTAV